MVNTKRKHYQSTVKVSDSAFFIKFWCHQWEMVYGVAIILHMLTSPVNKPFLILRKTIKLLFRTSFLPRVALPLHYFSNKEKAHYYWAYILSKLFIFSTALIFSLGIT